MSAPQPWELGDAGGYDRLRDEEIESATNLEAFCQSLRPLPEPLVFEEDDDADQGMR